MTTELTVYAEDAIATATLASIHPRLADLIDRVRRARLDREAR